MPIFMIIWCVVLVYTMGKTKQRLKMITLMVGIPILTALVGGIIFHWMNPKVEIEKLSELAGQLAGSLGVLVSSLGALIYARLKPAPARQ